jgi:hypothetical protein
MGEKINARRFTRLFLGSRELQTTIISIWMISVMVKNSRMNIHFFHHQKKILENIISPLGPLHFIALF